MKRESREGFKIRPDRCDVQESRFHFCDQVGSRESFDLTKSDDAQRRDCSFESEMDTCVTCAELHCSKGPMFLGSIHIHFLLMTHSKSCIAPYALLNLLSRTLHSPQFLFLNICH